jgi:hypothetical protein
MRPGRGLIYFTQVYTAMELAAKLWPCFKYIIPNRYLSGGGYGGGCPNSTADAGEPGSPTFER